MKYLLTILLLIGSALAQNTHYDALTCIFSNKIDTANLRNLMHTAQSNVGNEPMEVTMSKKNWVITYEGYIKCGVYVSFGVDTPTGDIQRDISVTNRVITITESSIHAGYTLKYNWYENGIIDTIVANSEYLVSGLEGVWTPIMTFGKFTDKDDAIRRAKQLWRTGKYYSIAVGNFCKKTSNTANAIYVCDSIVYRSKN